MNSPNRSKLQGEGDKEAARRYDKATRDFVEAERVDDAAAAAAPVDEEDAQAMQQAEREGLSHSKGEALADRGNTRPTGTEDETGIGSLPGSDRTAGGGKPGRSRGAKSGTGSGSA